MKTQYKFDTEFIQEATEIRQQIQNQLFDLQKIVLQKIATTLNVPIECVGTTFYNGKEIVILVRNSKGISDAVIIGEMKLTHKYDESIYKYSISYDFIPNTLNTPIEFYENTIH